jgi:signal peptidase II
VSPTARAWALAGGLCAFVAGADQAVKAVVEANLVTGEKVDVLGPLGLTLSHNRGVAFGLAGGSGAPLVLVALAALAVIAYLFAREPTRPGMGIATGLLAGGAIGNLIDRIASDAVTDYIAVGPWPAFNLADVAITCGVVLLAVLYLRAAERETGANG